MYTVCLWHWNICCYNTEFYLAKNLHWWVILYILAYYRPQRSCGKVMFLHLSVILFTGGVGVGGMHGRGHASRRDIHGRGHAWWGGMCGRGVCMTSGHAWSGGMHGREACMVGACVARRSGVCMARGPCMAGGVCGRRDGHCSGWCTSYWNAFFLFKS